MKSPIPHPLSTPETVNNLREAVALLMEDAEAELFNVGYRSGYFGADALWLEAVKPLVEAATETLEVLLWQPDLLRTDTNERGDAQLNELTRYLREALAPFADDLPEP